MMAELSSDLYRRCRNAFMQCSEFDSNALLRAIFITEELAPFSHALPEASNKAGRVDAALAYLIEKRLRDGRGALPLFVTALRDRYDNSDALWGELEALLSALLEAAKERKGDQSRSMVNSTEPVNGAKDVDPDLRQIKITFDRPMLPRSRSLTVDGGFDIEGVEPEHSTDGKTFTFTRRNSGPLEPNSTITVTVNPLEPPGAGFRDLAGLPAEPHSFSFTSRAASASPAIVVVRDMPAGGYADLTEALSRGEVCAFVGAGLSVGAKLPGWYDLIGELATRLNRSMPPKEWTTADAFIDIAQAYINRRGLFDLIAFLKDRLDTTGKRPSAAHLALARLPINVVFTANYDDLLEQAYRTVGKRVMTVVQDSDIPFMRRDPGSVNIVKLYGDLDRPDSIVLAREQYEVFFLKRQQMIKLLEANLGAGTMVYLGWSHSDPHFNLVFGEMLERFGKLIRPGYAAMFDVTEDQRLDLERKHIRIIEFVSGSDRTTQLATWLSSLAASSGGIATATRGNASTDLSTPTIETGPLQSDVPAKPALVKGSAQLTQPTVPKSLSAMPPDSSPDLELLVSLSADGQTLTYTLHSPEGDYHHQGVGSVKLAVPPRDLLQRTFDRLSTLAHLSPKNRTAEQTYRAEQELADVGSNLYNELLPPEFKLEYRTLREKHAGGNLLITSNEPWIPWEMIKPVEFNANGRVVYDDPPLCEMFKLARWVPGRAAPSRLALQKAVLVQPAGNLKAASAEAKFFAELPTTALGIAADTPIQSLDGVLDAFRAGSTQLYHFACHGNFDLTDPNESKLKLGDGFLSPSQLVGDRQSGLRRAKPLVFLNACHSGERGHGLTRLGGWAERFIAAGASAFIGSLWEINDEMAAQFSLEFYDRLLGVEGHAAVPLAEAFREARRVIRTADPANPTWLAYVLYGNPHAHMST